MIAALKWNTIPKDIEFELRGIGERYGEDNLYHLLLLGSKTVGKSSFLNSIVKSKFNKLQTEFDEVTMSLFKTGKDLVHIWEVDISPGITDKLRLNLSEMDGVLGMFDLTSADTFQELTEAVADLIQVYGKMFPYILLGNKGDLTPVLKQEDIMIYAYELGNVSCHQVPYVRISAIKNYGLDVVVQNIITMINCQMTSKCYHFPSVARQWCTIPHVNSLVKNANQVLETL